MTRVIEGTCTAWLRKDEGPQELLDGKVTGAAFFNVDCDMAGFGYTYLGPARFEIIVPDEKKMIENKIESLRAEQVKVLADAEAKRVDLERKIQTLLAIDFKG